MNSIVEMRSLKKYYGGRAVLDIPELVLERGKRYAFIGPNGSGKTTLLRILAGVIAPDEGEARVIAESVGYMPQKPYAFGFSVRRNVELANRDGKTARTASEAALEKVGLSHLARQKGDRLSGGETQRMAFARILAQKHELALMDEPTAATDIQAGIKMENALDEYLRETGCTLIFTTHAPSQAASMADEVFILEDGKIVEHGEAKQVLYEPRSESAKLFLSNWRLL